MARDSELEKAAKDLAQRARVGSMRRQLLTKLAVAPATPPAGPPTPPAGPPVAGDLSGAFQGAINPILAGAGGGALLGLGGSLINKNQRRRWLQNALTGGVIGGAGGLGYGLLSGGGKGSIERKDPKPDKPGGAVGVFDRFVNDPGGTTAAAGMAALNAARNTSQTPTGLGTTAGGLYAMLRDTQLQRNPTSRGVLSWMAGPGVSDSQIRELPTATIREHVDPRLVSQIQGHSSPGTIAGAPPAINTLISPTERAALSQAHINRPQGGAAPRSLTRRGIGGGLRTGLGAGLGVGFDALAHYLMRPPTPTGAPGTPAAPVR